MGKKNPAACSFLLQEEIGVRLIEGLPFYSCIIVLAFFLFMYYRLPLHVQQASLPL
jgi:hypothetical protein